MKRSALIPSDVIGNGEFRSACLTVLLMSAVFFATVLYAPQFMEKILGFSALKAGVGMVPMLGMFAVTSFIAGPLYGRLGAKLTVTAGAVGLTVGPFGLSMVDAGSSYSALIVGLAVTGVGAGLFYPSVTTAGVTALASARASLAGGLIYMFQIAGGAIGLGITTTIFTLTSENELRALRLLRSLSQPRHPPLAALLEVRPLELAQLCGRWVAVDPLAGDPMPVA
jgi:MFS family permease